MNQRKVHKSNQYFDAKAFILLLLINLLFVTPVQSQAISIGTMEGSLSVAPTGQAGYSIPIEVPPGVAGMQPTLSISYNTLSGNSPLGVGWAINGFSSISRCKLTQVHDGKFDGVDYDNDDRYCLEGQRLVAVNGAYGALDSEYRKEIDDFSKIVVTEVDTVNSTGPLEFAVYTKAGLRYIYGGKQSARVHKGNSTSQPVFEWKLNRIWDANGNYIEYHYYNDLATGEVLPSAISYTGNQQGSINNLDPSRIILFRYEDEGNRPDKFIKFQYGAKRALARRLEKLETYISAAGFTAESLSQFNPILSSATQVLEYNFNYIASDGSTISPSTHRTKLLSIQQCGIEPDSSRLCYPATHFEYSGEDSTFPFVTQESRLSGSQVPGPDLNIDSNERGGYSGDFNGDGIADAFVFDIAPVVYIEWLDSSLNLKTKTVGGDIPARPDDSIKHYYADFNGDGYTDILQYTFQYGLVTADSYIDVKLYMNKGHNNGNIEFYLETKGNGTPVLPDLLGIFIEDTDGGVGGDAYPASAPQIGDFNGDGLADVFYRPACTPDTVRFSDCISPQIFFRAPSGDAFQTGITLDDLAIRSTSALTMKVADFDGDGLSDIASIYSPIHYTTSSDSIVPDDFVVSTDKNIQVYFSNSSGNGHIKTLASEEEVEVGDFNNDGIADFLLYSTTLYATNTRLMLGKGDKTFAKATQVIPLSSDLKLWKKTVRVGDFNGDGATDLLIYKLTTNDIAHDGKASIYYSNGCSSAKTHPSDDLGCKFQTKTTDYVIPSGEFRNATSVTISDFNGDGLSDLYFIVRIDTDTSIELYPYIYLNALTAYPEFGRPTEDWTRNELGILEPPDPYRVLPDMLNSVTNGLGVEAKIYYKPLTSDIYTKEHEANGADNSAIQSSMYVVARTDASNGVGGYRTSEYRYAGARYHRTGRGFLGFSQVEILDKQKAHKVISGYSQLFPNTGMIESAEKWITVRGKEQLYTKSENILNKETIGHGINNTAPFTQFPYVEKSKTWTYDPYNPGPEITYTETTTTYSPQNGDNQSYGNASRIEAITRPSEHASNTLQQITENKYSNDTTNWYLGRLWCSSVTETVPEYPSVTRHSAFEYYPSNGQIKKEIIEPSGLVNKIDNNTASCGTNTDANLSLTTTYEYDETFGDIKTTTVSGVDIEPRATIITQNNAQRNAAQPVITATNALGHETTQTIDARWGAPLTQVDPDGDALRTEWIYNALGRLENEIKHQQAPMVNLHTTVEYSLNCFTTHSLSAYQIKTTTTGGAETAVCYDKLGRELASQTNGSAGLQTSSTHYDALGRVDKQSRELGGYWSFRYDDLDRLRAMSANTRDTSRTNYLYSGLTITTKTTNVSSVTAKISHDTSQTTAVTVNPIGQKVSVSQYIDESSTATSNYKYGPFANLKKIIGPSGEQVTYSYDVLGRKTKVHDLNLGQTTHIDHGLGSRFYTYYSTGELKTFEDTKGQVTENIYDKLGRIQTRIEDKNSESAITTVYEYDQAQKGSTDTWKGRLNKVTQNGVTFAEYTFNNNGYPETTQLTYDATNNETYTTNSDYDEYGRLDYTTYPENGWKIKNKYNTNGRLLELQDATDISDPNSYVMLWRDDGRNNAGQLLESSLGNGLKTVRAYNPNGALAHLETGLPSGSDTNRSVQHHSYKYDYLSNLLRRTNERRSLTETFQYDGISRLLHATVDNRRVEYRYNASGNLTFRSDLGTLKYEGTNNAGPHAVTRVVKTSGDYNGDAVVNEQDFVEYMTRLSQYNRTFSTAADCTEDDAFNVVDAACIGRIIQMGNSAVTTANYYESAFRYDTNGNMVEGGGRTIAYTSFNKPDAIQQERDNRLTTLDFDYTPEHNRLRKTAVIITDPGTPSEEVATYVTTYVGGLFDKTVKPDGSQESKFYLYADGALVAVKTISNNTPSTARIEYAHTDHLGSVEFFTDAGGNIIAGSETSFDAFGKRRNIENWHTDDLTRTTPEPRRGYTGHEQLDSIGLVHMNGRIYDPVLGRFMTADPYIPDLFNSQSLNRFSYVLNNPLSATDPTGYFDIHKYTEAAFRIFFAVAVSYMTSGSATGAAFGGFMNGMAASGGDWKQGVIGAFTSYLSFNIGDYQSSLTTSLAHGVVGGIGTLLSGEGFESGFLSAVVGAYGGQYAANNYAGTGRTVALIVVGGTSSVVGGGKFANGALSTAFAMTLSRANQQENVAETAEHLSEKEIEALGLRAIGEGAVPYKDSIALQGAAGFGAWFGLGATATYYCSKINACARFVLNRLAKKGVTNSGTKLLTHAPKTRFFKGDEAVQHFEKHSSELMQAFGRNSYNLKNYLDDANHVIKNGTFVPEMNGYVRLIGGQGSAKYGFVGLDRATGNITTFHVKSVSELSRKAPSLGFSK